MAVLNILWWIVYIMLSLIIQRQLPGVDALVSGFLIALKERNKVQIIVLFVLFTLIQEGTGSLKFGACILWYTGQVILFYISSRFFQTESFVSISLLSCTLAAYHGVIFWFMTAIQDYPLDYPTLFEQCIIQAIFVPIFWFIASRLRFREKKNGN